METGPSSSNDIRINGSNPAEATALANAVIDHWRKEGVTYRNAIIDRKNGSLSISALQGGALRSLSVVGCVSFGSDGEGSRCAVEILGHTGRFGSEDELRAKIFKQPAAQALILPPA